MKRLIIVSILLLFVRVVNAQNSIAGKITDSHGQPIAGAMVEVKGKTAGSTLSNHEGGYAIDAIAGDFLQISTSDGKRQIVKVEGNQCDVAIDRYAVVIEKGFDMQTTLKESTMASSSVGFDKMEKFSSLNPENALFGLLPGLIVLTNGGPIYGNNPTIKLRGIGTLNSSNALVLVDGIERPLDRFSVSEIETVTVLKDAAAVAVYGIRGANGVILVTTKRGEYGKIKVEVKYQHGITKPFRLPRMVDAPTYALALNEALKNDGLAPKYTTDQIELFRNGTNPNRYPNVDWQKEAIRESGNTNLMDVTFSGGSEKMRYFTTVSYANDFGLLKEIPSEEGYDTQIDYYKLNLRTNLDIKLTPTTQLKVNIMGSIDDYSRPNVAPGTIFQRTTAIPSAAFPVKTTSGNWGGNLIYTTQNPVAGIASTGFVRSQNRILFTDMNITQDLGGFIPGLTAEVGVGYDNMAEYFDTQARTFQYETDSVLYGNNSDLNFSSALNDMYMNSTFFAKLNHAAQFGNNKINSFLRYSNEQSQRKTRNNLVARQNMVAGVNLGFSDRYFVDVVGAYSGSSYLLKGDKFRFYPAVSAAWLLSNEEFLKKATAINMLKIRASYGLSGNDLMSYELDRQFYVSGESYYFNSSNATATSLKEGQLATKNLTSEMAEKANIGADIGLFNGLNISIDGFYEKRSNILVSNAPIISTILGVNTSQENKGIVENKGVEAAISYSGTVGDFKYGVSAQYTFARNKIVEKNEGYKPYPYLYTTGNPIGTYYGLQTNGFFKDAADIANSSAQLFSTVAPGDLKYVDQNGDKIIDSYDVIKLGYSTICPEIYYSFSVNGEYKGFGFDAQFQGIQNFQVARTAVDLYWPLTNNGNISDWYYNGGRWTDETRESAILPRLTTLANANNFRNNSLWMQDGSYLKLRYLEVYYNLPAGKIKPINGVKLFARGINLFSIDKIKDNDPETMTTSYPSLSSYYFGCTISF